MKKKKMIIQKGLPVAESFEALSKIAMERLDGARGFHMVCGPITTGGTGDPGLNLEILNGVIFGFKKEGKRLFDQTPYGRGLRLLADEWYAKGNTGYCMPILETFFKDLFEAGVITEGWFIFGWESSLGSRWEREMLIKQKGEIHDLTLEEVCRYMTIAYPPKKAKQIIHRLSGK